MRNLKELEKMLTKEQVEWFAERTNTTASGRIFFRSHVVNKFKKLTRQSLMSSTDARMEMGYIFSKYA